MMFNDLWHSIHLSNVEQACLGVTCDKGQRYGLWLQSMGKPFGRCN